MDPTVIYLVHLSVMWVLAWFGGMYVAELRMKRQAARAARRRQVAAGLEAVAAARGRHPSSR